MNKFRPQDLPKSYIFKQRLAFGRSDNYNWQSRIEWFPAGWSEHQKQFSRRFARLHYLACHAPKPIQKRWKPAYVNFCKKLFGVTDKMSMRYANTYTCHKWL